MSDSELVSRILAGEEHLFNQLVARYAGCVWAVCSSYIPGYSDREEVAQDVFLKCYLRLHTIRRPGALGRWLCQTARRRSLDWLRANSRRKVAMKRYEEHAARTHRTVDDEDSASLHEVRRAVLALVQTLPRKTREALLLHYSEGYSVSEAAEALGISPDAMAKRLRYGRKLLQDRVGDELEPALSTQKHKEDFTRAAMAAIPFGTAPWLTTAVSGAAAGVAPALKPALLGGVAIMSKKALVVVAAVVLLFAAIFSIIEWSGGDAVEEQRATTAVAPADAAGPEVPAPGEGPVAVAASATEPAVSDESAEGQSQPVAEGVTPVIRPAVITGYVRDDGGYPLVGASILVEVTHLSERNDILATYTATSGVDGGYEVAGITTFGNVELYASAEGYLMQRFIDRVEVVAGRKRDQVNFALAPAAYIVAGWVVNESNQPIPGACVGTPHFGYSEDGHQQMQKTGGKSGRGPISDTKQVFAVTDDGGHFAVAVQREGFCDFMVAAEGIGTGYFPKVHTGTEDALFVLKSAGAIAGRVTRRDGTPVGGTRVKVVGHAFPGGLDFGVQSFPTAPVSVLTVENGHYLAERLGEDYAYTLTVFRADEVLPEEKGLRKIASAVSASGGGRGALGAERTGIRVTAGRTTSGVDLVLDATLGATVHGSVTDRTSGAPACPVVVCLEPVEESDEPSGADLGDRAVTRLDGTYRLRTGDLTKTHEFQIRYEYMTEGGSSWPQPEEPVANLSLSRGDEEELDFAVDAPLDVPVRYVDEAGATMEGVSAALRRATRGTGGCGGSLISDAEGRVTFHGIPPFVSLRAVAWSSTGMDNVDLGVSEPFTGQPGEAVPEVVVVCHAMGGIEGVVVTEDGQPVANTSIACFAVLSDGTLKDGSIEGVTDGHGGFAMVGALPVGGYQRILIGYGDPSADDVAVGIVEGIEVAEDSVSDVGAVICRPTAVAEAARMLGYEE